MSIETAVTTNIIATALMVFTYTYLFVQYRHVYLAKWVMAWVVYAARGLLLEKQFIAQSSPIIIILYIVVTYIFSILLIAGAVEFSGKRLSNYWPISGALCLLSSCVGVLLKLPFSLYVTPGVVFIGSAYIGTGLMIWQVKVPGLGRVLAAGAFILLGLHMFDMPLLFPLEWFVPWGFLIDGLLKIVIAISIIIVYFEKAKNEVEKYYRLLAENTTDVIYRYRLIEPCGFEYISPAIKQLSGYDASDFKAIRQVLRVIHPDDRQKFKELFYAPVSSDGFATLRVINRNGDLVWAEQKYSFVHGADGRLVAVEGIVRDVTKRVLLEQDVSRLDRLNIAGQMAANLAHEVRNPLTTVRGYLQIMGNKREFQHYKEQFGLLLEELDRTNSIISEYLSLSKNKMVDMKQCNINDIIRALYPLVQADAVTSKIEVGLVLGEIPDLPLDDKEIKQLVLNLTRNAIEAMPKGGKLEIGTRREGEDTILTVKDQGKGIPHHVLHNLGKPFLTTKDSGTGLGMAICYRIASRHKAKLDIETGPAGTTIHVRFRNS